MDSHLTDSAAALAPQVRNGVFRVRRRRRSAGGGAAGAATAATRGGAGGSASAAPLRWATPLGVLEAAEVNKEVLAVDPLDSLKIYSDFVHPDPFVNTSPLNEFGHF